ncbi:exosome nuclease subunit [Tulasnella sp. 418]|nr:exosome nuclease subunit [Tulasnella sp. 418]
MFDTYHAAAVLDFPKKSLAALLSLYCNFTADKRYQLADWRIRPLPEEMLFYARSDTHFLLYVYDSLRNALIDRANGQTTAIYEVLRRSEKTALNTYVKESYDAQFGSGLGGWDNLARQWNKVLFGNTKAIFIAIHAWRDQVAREEDESTKFVLPNRFLFSLAERPPTTIAGLLIMVQPASPIVKARTQELLTVIKEASEAHVAPIEASKSSHSTSGDLRTSEVQTNITHDAMLTDINDSVETGLWDHARNQAVLSTKSSLFGPTIEPSPNTLPYIASKSTLFGSFGAAVSHSTHDDRFQEIVHKIHNNLVLSPSIARIMRSAGLQPPAAISEKAKIQPDPEPEIPKEPEQLPFIPAAQRQTTSTNNLIGGQSSNKKGKAREDDSSDPEIVQVGAPKAKKRKRNKRLEELSTENGENSVSSSTSPPMDDQQPKNGGSKGSLEDIKDFDYSSVPNLLDENMDSIQEESQRPGKKRKTRNPSKGAKGLDGGFPSAPKARNEPKSGNRSITYK